MIAPETILQHRYRVIRRIGQGGMGTVYEAADLRLGNIVALKQMLLEQADPQHTGLLRRAFEREARLLASLRHPALPRVIDHFDEPAGQFLVMEYIPGDDLAELQTKNGGPLPLDLVLRWADQLLDALEYLHGQDPPVIHRDIKPQNLKLTPRGEIILLDFGLAKGLAALAQPTTTTASLFGYTPQYAPLEQIQGSGTDHRSDLYSFAATLYRLLTGLAPASALARTTALVDHQPDPLRPLHEVMPSIPLAVSGALMHALALSAADRPASASALRAELSAARAASPATAPTIAHDVTQLEPLIPVRTARQPPWGALLASTLVVVLGMLGFFLLNRDATPGGTESRATEQPSSAPAALAPTTAPSQAPPTAAPTQIPPTAAPAVPTARPTAEPTAQPTAEPTVQAAPSGFAIGQLAYTRAGAPLDLFVAASGTERVFDRPKLFGGAEVILLTIEPAAVQLRTPEGLIGWIHAGAEAALTAEPASNGEQAPYQPGARVQIVRSTGIPLRQEPRPNAPKLVEQLKLDQQATIDEARGDWLRITLDDGTSGWARWYYDGDRYIEVITTVPGAPAFARTLVVQSPRLSGDDVRAAQQRLYDLGYREVGEIDGLFGPNSANATKRFQQANRLAADGVIGPATWAKLFSPAAVRGD